MSEPGYKLETSDLRPPATSRCGGAALTSNVGAYQSALSFGILTGITLILSSFAAGVYETRVTVLLRFLRERVLPTEG